MNHRGSRLRMIIALLLTAAALSAQAKRLRPKPVAAVTHLGLRYEVPHFARNTQRMKHNGGYVRVVNTRDGAAICTKQVYEVTYDPNLETDVQDNFITSIKIEGKDIVIASEKQPPIRKSIANFCD